MKTGLTSHEWDFSTVPEHEVHACLVYEFTRESPTALEIAAEWRQLFTPGKDNSDARQYAIRGKAECLRPKFRFPFPERAWGAFVYILQTLIHAPWGSLPEKTRRGLSELLKPSPPAYVGDIATARGAFNILCEKAHPRVSGPVPSMILQEIGPIPEAAVLTQEGQEIVLLVVDWSSYSDGEIREAVTGWIRRRRRPADIKAGSRFGRGVRDSQVSLARQALRRLGMARLRAWGTTGELRASGGPAWRFLNEETGGSHSLEATERRLRKAAKYTLVRFREFFPSEAEALPMTIQKIQKRTRR